MAQEQFNPDDFIITGMSAVEDGIAGAAAAMSEQVNDFRDSGAAISTVADGAQGAALELPPMDIEAGKVDLEPKEAAPAHEEFDKPEGDGNKIERLSRVEKLIVKGFIDAVRGRDANGIQDMLQTILENPKSMDKILRAARAEIQELAPSMQVGWETGSTDDGRAFVRMKFDRLDTKSGPFTHLTIGDIGPYSADHRNHFTERSQNITAREAFSLMMDRREGDRYLPQKPEKPVQPEYGSGSSTLKR